jgi:hypothetical protein
MNFLNTTEKHYILKRSTNNKPLVEIKGNNKNSQSGVVAQACNISYLGGSWFKASPSHLNQC